MNKKTFINCLYTAGNLSVNKNDYPISLKNDLLMLVTAAGQITGTILEEADSSSAKSLAGDIVFQSAGKAFTKKTNQEDFILLKNVDLQSGNNVIHYQYLYVFTDDIIAVTVGNSGGN